MVAGLTNGELIVPMTYEETMTSDFFEAWFQKFLLPTLTTPSVIIMDNARFHRMGKLELLCEEFGHKLLPLPPYSPEYNPIEKTWAHIKKHLVKGITKLLQYLLRGFFILLLFQLTIVHGYSWERSY
ncbi:IS630-Spn1, transposase Orf2 [Streptococcus pneumoniae]|nr:IS630-Spn1, transposase Orf2 [Streptococcus pneumoniae]VPR34389.1 IS630-Spn1, transposase Orf2 [Streptococcus pneumoniae]